MVLRAMLFVDVARSLGEWRVESVRVLKTRANLPTVVVLIREPQDLIKEQLLAQLEGLNHLVKVCVLPWCLPDAAATGLSFQPGNAAILQRQTARLTDGACFTT